MKKIIVITGGNSGLGKATAKILSPKYRVVILGKNEKEILKVKKEFGCDGILCDVTDTKQIKKAIFEIIRKYKKIDCFVNCAGIYISGPVEENDPERIKNTILVNTLGPMLTINAIVPQFKKQKFGRIVNVVSQAGLVAKADRSVYFASKWAITGFTKCLQLELAPHNIGVMGFYPGFFHTNIFKKAGIPAKDFSTAMPVNKVARMLSYMIEIDDDLVIRELEIQSLNY